ncbi:uncharacterized protein LOC142337800 isoform X2 [Convolutriloba macropyga]|uniref:uncharacterized protein LOC142337800 isoform X2 n=1 Tax=Convolutriloba macropyga TaxID=536237 RepID=UPI003F526856
MGAEMSIRPREGFVPGNKLVINCDKKKLKQVQEAANAWNSDLKDLIGKQLALKAFDKDGDAMVEYNNKIASLKLKILDTVPPERVIIEKSDWVQLVKPEADLPIDTKGVVYEKSTTDGETKFKVAFLKDSSGNDVTTAEVKMDSLKWIRKQAVDIGDDVSVISCEEACKSLQDGHGEYNESMQVCLTDMKGMVKKFTPKVDAVTNFQSTMFGSGSRTFVFNVNLLVNISPPLIECSVGDKLKIISNAKKFKRVQKHVVKNWNDSMKRFAGRPCTVVQIPESSRTTETDDTDETILDEIGVKLYGNDEIVTVSRKVVECFQEDLFEGEKVVSLLSGSQLVEITGNDAFKNYNNQEGVIVSSPDDSGSEKGNLLVQLDNGTQLTFPSQLLQSCVDPESDTDDSDAETDSVEFAFLVAPNNGLSVGDRLVTNLKKQQFIRGQQSRGGDHSEKLFDCLSKGTVVLRGFSSRALLIVSSDSASGDDGDKTSGRTLWKVSRKGLQKAAQKEDECLVVGDTVKLTSSDKESSSDQYIIVSETANGQFKVTLPKSTSCEDKLVSRSEITRVEVDKQLTMGDEVKVYPNKDLFDSLQKVDSLPFQDIHSQISDQSGFVQKILLNGAVSVKFEGVQEPVSLSCNLLFKEKPTQFFKVGDKVKMIEDMARVRVNQQHHGEWLDQIKEAKGKVGSVFRVINNASTGRKNDVSVKFADTGKVIELIMNPRSLIEWVEEFKRGDKVVCALKYDEMKSQLPDNYHMEGLHHLKEKHMSAGMVDKVHGSGNEAVITVRYSGGIEIKYMARNILKVPSTSHGAGGGAGGTGTGAGESGDEGESSEDEGPEYVFLTAYRGLAVGDRVGLSDTFVDKDKEDFLKVQREKKGDTDEELFTVLKESRGVVRGFSTKCFLIISAETHSGKADRFWRVTRKVLKKNEDSQLLMVGDLVDVKTQDGESSEGRAVILSDAGEDMYMVVFVDNDCQSGKAVAGTNLKRVTLEEQLTVGDEVKLYPHRELIEVVQKKDALSAVSDVESLFTQFGYVENIAKNAHISVMFEGRSDPVTFSRNLVYKSKPTTYFKVGDKVKLLPDLARLKSNQRNHGEWLDTIQEGMGKIGSVFLVIDNKSTGRVGDVKVKFADSEKVIPMILNTRSLVEVQEEFSKGDKIICAITLDELRPTLTDEQIETMEGLQHLEAKHMTAGRVIKVRGSGSTALVTVKYGDDIQIKYLAQYILKVPAGGSDSGAAGLSGLAELLAGRGLEGPGLSLLQRLAADSAGGNDSPNRRRQSSSSSSSSSDESAKIEEVTEEGQGANTAGAGDGDAGAAGGAGGDDEKKDGNEDNPAEITDPALVAMATRRSMSMGAKTVSCVLCYNSDVLVALKCGHILCETCAKELLENESLATYRKCPLDRKHFRKYIKLFL